MAFTFGSAHSRLALHDCKKLMSALSQIDTNEIINPSNEQHEQAGT
jgi:hypothetical protein